MEKTIIFGEILYIGFVTEKGRCKPNGIWKLGYKNILYEHVRILNEVSTSLLNEFDFERDQCILKHFLNLCKKEKQIGKFYPISEEKYKMLASCDCNIINSFDIKKNNNIINKLIVCLTRDILELLNKKSRIDKESVYMLLRSVHNLPRYYLNNEIGTLCEINQKGISVQNALEYSYLNMDNITKEKYNDMYKNILSL